MADEADCTLIQHSASLSGGTSGSPMLNIDGQVVALNNANVSYLVVTQKETDTHVERTPSAAEIGLAIRVDVLTKLLKDVGW